MNKRSRVLLWFLGTACSSACAHQDDHDEGVAGRHVQELEALSVIVHFGDRLAPDTSLRSDRARLIGSLQVRARQSQARALALLQSKGLAPTAVLWISNALAVTAPRSVLAELSSLPEVESVSPDLLLSAPGSTSESASSGAWNLDLIGAPSLWALGLAGAGMTVATLDTGVDASHPALAASYGGRWFDPFGERTAPGDASGHGTQVMGLIAGSDVGGTPVGVAPGAKWIAARIYNDAGQGSLSAIHRAFQWVLDPDSDPATPDAPHVVNASWGFGDQANQCLLEFEADLSVLRAAGISIVFAAGNSGPAALSSVSPANNPSAFATGSVDALGRVESTSGRGPGACDGRLYPDVVAPGVGVRTTDRTFGGLFPESYVIVSGTSFAAPHVTGAIALLRGAYPEATVEQAERALKQSATDLGDAGPDFSNGNGLINIEAARLALGLIIAEPVCTDADKDGYMSQPGCGTSVDCSDSDPSVHPGACDIKSDGIDQDCDGVDRISGARCSTSGSDGTTTAEGKGRTCSDKLDNDNDGMVDCADPDCLASKSCP